MILHRIDDNVCIGSFALDEAAYPLSLSQCSPTSIHPSNAGSQSLSLSPLIPSKSSITQHERVKA